MTTSLKNVIITLPAKALTKNNIHSGYLTEKLNFTTPLLMKSRKELNHMDINIATQNGLILKQENPTVLPRGKKRRLDHLTWEEKLQRKKLKNRVAAQTSRDRKKARLDELEYSVHILREEKDSLAEECEMLRRQNESLVTEMKKLRKENERLRKEGDKVKVESSLNCGAPICSMCQGHVDCTNPALGSAVSSSNPLQQGGIVQTANCLTQTKQSNISILMKILTLYLLSKTYLESSKGESSTQNNLKNLPKAFCKKLPQEWKQTLLKEMNRKEITRKKVAKDLILQNKWWGRHQVMWKPIQLVEA